MTDELAGLVLAGFHGTTADGTDLGALCDLGVGGFIVFGRNVESPSQVAELLAGITARCGQRPVIFAVDQEGGRVARLRAPLTVWPPMGMLGEANDPGLAHDVGLRLAEEIAAVGFTLDFAPCLDVNSHPDNPVIGDRALADEPDRVQRLGVPLLQGLQRGGIAACAKHFPGHGHVDLDSHHALPVCHLDRPALDRGHLAPFRAAIEAGVASIMTAHVVYPAVDADQPATLSPAWIDGVLRGELGWEGPVLSDDLEMGAILGLGGVGDAAVRAVRAGVDGLLVCHRRDRIEEAVRALRAEADRDADFAARCQISLGRLRTLAAEWPSRPSSDLHARIAVGGRVAARVTSRSSAPTGDDPTDAAALRG